MFTDSSFTSSLTIDNAYVAGLKEDLGFEGNELVQLQTMYIVGAVVGQIPFMYLFTCLPMHWIVPFLDVSWGIFTLLQYRSNSFAELAAYRFLVGLFEVRIFLGNNSLRLIPCLYLLIRSLNSPLVLMY